MRTLHQRGWALGLFFLSLTSAVNSELLGPDEPEDLMVLSLEELMQQRVTSVSRKPQRLSQAAAVFVITAEDIHRSGVLTIADALRMVPRLDVARIDANKWAIQELMEYMIFEEQDFETLYLHKQMGIFLARKNHLNQAR